MRNLKRRIACILGLSLLLSVGPLWSQMDRGTITGTVTDPSGAVIVGASVTATNTATAVATRTVTTSAGIYTIPVLKVGTYEVTVDQSGFKKFVQSGIILEASQTVRVDATMQLGLATQTVEVTAQAAPLQRDTSDRGTVISSRDVQELPIVSSGGEQRNPGFYMTLAPGVTGKGTALGTASGGGRQLTTTVNGSPSGSTEFHLDGAIIGQAGMFSGDFRLLPFPPEAVGEFNVMTLNPPAEFGATGLGITSFSIRSGSNQLHGSVYELFRNDALDARGFYAPSVPPNKQNEFGATVGGPVVIPKLYNGKDKTFFYGWYHGFRLHKAVSNALDTVPTAAMRGGNLSNMLSDTVGKDALGRPVYGGEIYDPATQRTVAAGAADSVTGLVNTSGSAAILRDAFGFDKVTGLPIAGQANIIPDGRIDPLAKKIFTYFPDPKLPGRQFGYTYNWLSQFAALSTINQWGSKVDHSIGANHRIMGEFIWWKNYAPTGSKWPGAISEGAFSWTQQDIARFSHDWFIRPNLVNHWVAGYNRYRNDTYPQAGTGWPATLGYAGVPQTGPGSTFIEMDIGGLGNTYARGGQGYSASNYFSIDESLTWTKGRHTIKTGFSYVKMQNNAFGSTYQSSYLTFDAGTTALPGPFYLTNCRSGGGCTGMGAAGFLLGLVTSGRAGITIAPAADRWGRYAGYVQDDIKATPKLTLNLGLRYDLMLPTVNAHNQFSWMDPLATQTALGIKGALVFATPDRRAGAMAEKKAFGPRIGLAYAFNNQTVLRSSYGIMYAAGGAQRSHASSWEQLGYSASNSVLADASTAYAGLLPGFILKDGWPASRFRPPPFIDPGYENGLGPPSYGAYPGDENLPYLQNWTVSIQRQIPGQILLDVAYVGTKGTHLPSRLQNSNVMPTQYLKYQDLLSTGIKDPSVQALPIVQAMPVDLATGMHVPFQGFQALWGGNATLGQSLRPFPQYTTDTVEGLSQLRDFGEVVGVSNYNALQIQARKHFSQGLSFLVSYTWSKTLSDAEGMFNEFSGFTQDYYNRKAEKALSINDYPHNLVMAYEYQLPFGKGKKFVNVGGPANKVIGGWTIAGVQQYQSGPPAVVVAGGTPPGYPYVGPTSFMSRANSVPGVMKKSPALLNGTWDPNGAVVHNDGSACSTANPCTATNAIDRGAMWNANAWTNPQSNPATKWMLGNGPRTDGGSRRFGYLNEDISIIKRTNITERVNVEFRADFLNIFNRTLFAFDQGGDQYGSIIGGSSLGGGLGSFGHVAGQGNWPREIQFGLKINY